MRVALLAFLLAALAGAAQAQTAAPVAGAPSADAFGFSFVGIDGTPLPLAQYRGQPLLVVNVAAHCGFTPQFEGLQALFAKYRERGLMVIGVPSNDFGNQGGSEAEIKETCAAYQVAFPQTDLYPVTGAQAHPFYAWAAQELGPDQTPRWNFHKYLVGADGKLRAAFGPRTAPDAPELAAAIEAALAAR